MILFTICVVAVLVGLVFYLRDMGMLGGPNRDPIRGGVVPEIPPNALDSIRDYTYMQERGSSTWDEVKHMRDVQEKKQFDVLGWSLWQYDNKDEDVDDSGPDCE